MMITHKYIYIYIYEHQTRIRTMPTMGGFNQSYPSEFKDKERKSGKESGTDVGYIM